MLDDRVPKYYQLKKILIEKINNEEFEVNVPIPSERELTELYQVSRITVRKAIEELVNEGYLYKIQGKGTYVKTDEGEQPLLYYKLYRRCCSDWHDTKQNGSDAECGKSEHETGEGT